MYNIIKEIQMGIRLLNKFLTKHNKRNDYTTTINISDLKGKKIAIDTSIYLYRFLEYEQLLEKMFYLCSVFKKNKIKPIFVFDGKPPEEKKETINKRKEVRHSAEMNYNRLIDLKRIRALTNVEIVELEKFRKRKTRITGEHIKQVKSLLDNYGINYIDAEGEADELCYKLVNSGTVYACLSDDTDMFVYGTNTIIKNLNLTNLTVDIFHIQNILSSLKLNMYQFRIMCMLSGTDYTVINNGNETKQLNSSIYTNYKSIQKYRQELKRKSEIDDKNTLISWLVDNKLIHNGGDKELLKIYSIYDTGYTLDKSILTLINKKKISNINQLCNILKSENFII